LQKHSGDPLTLSAVLTAPAYLSGLSESEFAFAKKAAESHLPKEALKDRGDANRALDDLERGWARGKALIAENAGLVRGLHGDWILPSEAAA
jgi:hypothetical protein